MHLVTAQKELAIPTGLLIVLSLALGIKNLLGVEGTWVEPIGPFWAGMIGIVPAVLLAVGLWANPRSPHLGALLFLGAVPLSIGMIWTIVFPALAALGAVFSSPAAGPNRKTTEYRLAVAPGWRSPDEPFPGGPQSARPHDHGIGVG